VLQKLESQRLFGSERLMHLMTEQGGRGSLR